MAGKGIFICMLVTVAILIYPLGIATTVVGATHPGDCDKTDKKLDLNAAKYCLGLGISSLITGTLLIIALIMIMNGSKAGIALILPLTILNALFGIIWFCIGAVILFRANGKKKRPKSKKIFFSSLLPFLFFIFSPQMNALLLDLPLLFMHWLFGFYLH